MVYVDPELKEKLIKLRLQEGRTYKSLSDEFGYSREIITRIVKQYQADAARDEETSRQLASMEELRRLKLENDELKKENDFLKKAAAFFAKESK